MKELKFLLFVGLCLGTWTELYATYTGSCRDNRGITRHSGSTWKPDSCHSCTCYNRRISCKAITCPRLTCSHPVKKTGYCCPVCPTPCKDNRGIVRHSGTTWKADSCLTCTCYNGRISCKVITCPRLTCSHPVKKTGYCCPVCPAPCKDNRGIVHHSGSTWKADPCHTCTCYSGRISCKAVICPRLTCSNPVKKTGYCCPVCPAPCKDNRGIVRHSGSTWKADPCHTCTCYNGRISCKAVICPRLTCSNPVKKTGYCCPVCPAPCKDNRGIVRHSGTTWKADPCLTCTCYNGRIICKVITCPRLTCSHPVKKIGYCCPVCPVTCKDKHGNTRQNGESWMRDACTKCICKLGQVVCAGPSCAKPNCEKPITPPGKCCPICPVTCKDKHGNTRQNGESWMRDACTKCICKLGQVVCAGPSCAKPNCEKPITPPGKCCPICPVTCKDKHGNTRQNGESWMRDACTKCICKLGQVVCAGPSCAKPNCEKPITPPGKCCPICPVTCKDKHGNTRQNGESWKRDACTTCTCMLGQVVCAAVACAKPNCDKPFTPPGKCCPICPARCKDRFGNYHDSGDKWQPDPCTFCTCDNGQKHCAVIDCAPAGCDLPVTPKGKCCPTCDEAPCRDNQGMKRDDDAVWKENPCKTCRCNDGKVTCDTMDCPKPDCEHPVNVPGKCCDTCDMAPCSDDKGMKRDNGAVWKENPCKTCRCKDGKVTCDTMDCPKPDCEHPVNVPGKCCDTCDMAPCSDDKGMKRDNGAVWKENPCKTCRCKDGKVTCDMMHCPKPDCEHPVNVPEKCCDTCDMAPCSDDKGMKRDNGAVWKENPCKTCRCKDGKVTCDTMDCPKPDCEHPVNVPGKCCDTCDMAPCRDNQGMKRDDDAVWKESPCKTCRCNDGKVTCDTMNCPKPDCEHPVNVPGKCCDTCDMAPCSDEKGMKREDGTVWRENPCKTCRCNDGKVTCDVFRCPKPDCDHPVNVPEKCCATCDMAPCRDNQGMKRDDDAVWQENPCKTCRCNDGKVTCDTMDCPKPDCELPVNVHGKCCDTCDMAPCTDDQGMKRVSGAVWRENPCKICRCDDGHATCDKMECPKPDCEHPMPVPGKCCPTCNMAPCKDKDGVKRDHDEKWKRSPCEGCTCKNGNIDCYVADCVPTKCDHPVQIPGECCATCDKAPCKDKHGVKHDHNEEWKVSPCEGCTCRNGEIHCYVEDCPELDCKYPMQVPGKCCRTCEKAPCRDNNGVEHSHGKKWKVSDCEGCECNNGNPVCYIQDCARPQCDNPVKIPGQCCHTCDKAPCRDNNGVEHSHGEKWKVDDCQGCECNNGKPVCYIKDCARPQCDNPVKIPGQCCPVCKDTGTCDDNGNMRKDGEEWKPSPCKTCTCHKGHISCKDKHCYDPPCKDPVNIPGQCCPVCPKPVTCKAGKKEGLCKPARDCKKPAKHNNPCPSVKCEQGNICCFTKKNKPPKSVCFPQPPGEECVIKSDYKTYKGECREKSKCRKPMVACAGYDRCTGGKWCCLKKKDKPPQALCGGMKGRK